jgi:hypothetical protein
VAKSTEAPCTTVSRDRGRTVMLAGHGPDANRRILTALSDVLSTPAEGRRALAAVA